MAACGGSRRLGLLASLVYMQGNVQRNAALAEFGHATQYQVSPFGSAAEILRPSLPDLEVEEVKIAHRTINPRVNRFPPQLSADSVELLSNIVIKGYSCIVTLP